jgi:hypothetical protein
MEAGRQVGLLGVVSDVDTSDWGVGDVLFVDSTPGELTNVPPVDATKRQILVGYVLASHPTDGAIYVLPNNTPFPFELSGQRRTITGSRADSEGALKDLLAKLEADGYITDNTTA